MRKVLRAIGLGLLALVLILAIVLAVFLPGQIKASFPQIDGEIRVPGLDGRVDIYRDNNGIPHIFATTEHDLFFAQGYVHAQDRFWQMDFQRHTSTGRLSELLGSNTVGVDKFLRTLGWERVARAELALLDATSRMMLESYAEGVNAYLAEHTGTSLSLEYLFLKLLNSGYTPAPWEPLHSVSWGKAMAWDLRDNMDTEIERAIMLKTLTPQQIAELFPPYPDDKPVIAPEFYLSDQPVITQSGGDLHAEEVLALMQVLDARTAALDALLNSDPSADLGSNSWVVSGHLSATGMPLFANDPHLGASIPSIWYQVGLHCAPAGPNCQYNAAGVSFPGVPGIVLGHNDRIAWGFTNVGPDVMDLYVIRVNPDNPHQYEMNGQWLDMQVIVEEIVVAGGETIPLEVRITQFGPIVSDTYGDLEDFDETSGLDLPSNYALALSWTALQPGNSVQSLFRMNRATNFEEFREAASAFVAPSQNFLYADVDGNIGYQMPGLIPIRTHGDGLYPAPGWTDEYAWFGFIPFEQLPYAFNPASGYIVTANNAVVGAENYPYRISDTWDYGYRAQRIVDLIENAPGPIDIAYYEMMLGDDMNLGALPVVDALTALDYGDARLNELRGLLAGWDGMHTKDSAGAALFAPVWKHLLALTFNDDLPEIAWPNAGGGSGWYVVVENLLADPQSAWWDDSSTPERESRDDILRRAFAAGVAEVEDKLGKDQAKWAWGDLHTITFEHGVMSNFPLIDRLFNRGPYRLSGGNSIVNATSWGGSPDYSASSTPSKRTILDLSNWQNGLQITTVGQSGHANHPHYDDLAPLWSDIQFIPLHWDLAAIQAAAEGHLILQP